MDEKDRPGGLTALAVINFIFAVFSLIGIFWSLIAETVISSIPTDQMTEAQAAQIAAVQDSLQNMSGLALVIITCVGVISFLLLLLSGIGYLKQKRVMGRILGSSYGVLSILNTVLSTIIFAGVFGGSFGIGAIIGLIYPVLTLILINTLYKDDLIY